MTFNELSEKISTEKQERVKGDSVNRIKISEESIKRAEADSQSISSRQSVRRDEHCSLDRWSESKLNNQNQEVWPDWVMQQTEKSRGCWPRPQDSRGLWLGNCDRRHDGWRRRECELRWIPDCYFDFFMNFLTNNDRIENRIHL